MLTGRQIAAARKLAGIKTQAELAELAGVSEPAIARAEAKGAQIPGMNTTNMAAIILALEARGVEFFTKEGNSLAGGVGMRLKGDGND
ncbi:Xre family transcriptional regulator [Azospirillum baldaniorum]|uniref:helix-turn-helix domain-containing protein n=1 Tax=Azospirillum baldaniorum TaxID=1064539 RepID=UPI0011A8BC80|nr:transcriptional regulator [Azospirillum baldaniorum]TWA71945.1 Xre family transcriptional regulator [Azospirillum baldaniorum]